MRWKILAVGVLLIPTLQACSDPVDPCQVNPTRQAADGTWVEADGEPLDDDPCDAEDLEHDGLKVKKTKKPAPKVTVKKKTS